jgi:phage terminase large subunit-like protein
LEVTEVERQSQESTKTLCGSLGSTDSGLNYHSLPFSVESVLLTSRTVPTVLFFPQLKQWLPAFGFGEWIMGRLLGLNHKILTLENGSQVEIRSYEQELEKFAGVPRHFIHFDEEPPYDIFKECKARLADYNGRWWMTMTPVDGMTWTYEEIFEKRHTPLLT